MSLRSLAFCLCLALVPSAASAGLVTYDFAGENGLTGTFKLDATAPFDITTIFEDTLSGVLSSPENRILFSFGGYKFSGVHQLHVMNQPSLLRNGEPPLGPDSWIVRASDLIGPEIDGRMVSALNLFVYQGAAELTDISVVAPPPHFDPFSFQYTLGFSDGTFTGGALSTLEMRSKPDPTKVPEPASISLVLLGCGFVVRARLRARRREQYGVGSHVVL